ncbi:hypothetical protein CONPUDRAFT_72221 [Coniophora puteana RWD-64-598 SS2]|uniref:Uncharacterized protein n=1 Tax=Coniophora puteana (strain RWD-64-598) TaxID=741705 RepID=A0A5M3MRR0_CONPW|nr:uncharacterized protein CONPUDRAFT_72221 [Coniophora puteana RWD-64-598 SS2]EIW81839.1 hypothetical protein CONPUDRAFT_72221 [Coniophora puteana RWD-64-598 SS2]
MAEPDNVPDLPTYLPEVLRREGWQNDSACMIAILQVLEARVRRAASIWAPNPSMTWSTDWLVETTAAQPVVEYIAGLDIDVPDTVVRSVDTDKCNPWSPGFPFTSTYLEQNPPVFPEPASYGTNCWWDDYDDAEGTSNDGPAGSDDEEDPPVPAPPTRKRGRSDASSDADQPPDTPSNAANKGKGKGKEQADPAHGRRTRASARAANASTEAGPSHQGQVSGSGSDHVGTNQMRVDSGRLLDLQRDVELLQVRITTIADRMDTLVTQSQFDFVTSEMANLRASLQAMINQDEGEDTAMAGPDAAGQN